MLKRIHSLKKVNFRAKNLTVNVIKKVFSTVSFFIQKAIEMNEYSLMKTAVYTDACMNHLIIRHI